MQRFSQRVRSTLIAYCLLAISAPVFANELLQQRIEAWQMGFSPSVLSEQITNKDLLIEFYIDNEFRPLWLDGAAPSAQANELQQVISSIGAEGLVPNDYHNTLLLNEHLSPIDRELALSDAVLTLLGHLLAGKTEAYQLGDEWKASPRPRALGKFLPALQRGEKLSVLLNEARPQQIRYYRLIDAIATYEKLTLRDWFPLANSPAIKLGAKDSRLLEISERLKLLGDLDQTWEADDYNETIKNAMRSFQLRHGLKEDGDIGRESFAALNITPAQRIKQLVVNLERWRWLDSDLGETFVVVNIAGFDLRVISKGETIFQQPVIVGRDYRKTPVFSDKIRYLVFNPTWTVPPKLAIQDKLPEIQKNPNYFQEYGFSVYQGGSTNAIEPNDVDWSQVNRRNFNYRLVQSPGPLNALGQVKFMFPNAFDVYLHDTPARDLFSNHQRAFSSGCIRVLNPLLLAELLLKDEGWDKDKIDALIQSKETKTVYLKTPMPVHMEYWTAWVERSGVIHFRNDIYQRDEALFEALIHAAPLKHKVQQAELEETKDTSTESISTYNSEGGN